MLGKPRTPGRRPIRGHDFKRWRKSLDFSQKEAAHALGLKRRVVQYYEKGQRDGKEIDIPKAVRLACLAIANGAEDYRGPDTAASDKSKRKTKAKHKTKGNNGKARKSKRKAEEQGSKSDKRKAKARLVAPKPERVRSGKEKR